jgi:hypothetical protein
MGLTLASSTRNCGRRAARESNLHLSQFLELRDRRLGKGDDEIEVGVIRIRFKHELDPVIRIRRRGPLVILLRL